MEYGSITCVYCDPICRHTHHLVRRSVSSKPTHFGPFKSTMVFIFCWCKKKSVEQIWTVTSIWLISVSWSQGWSWHSCATAMTGENDNRQEKDDINSRYDSEKSKKVWISMSRGSGFHFEWRRNYSTLWIMISALFTLHSDISLFQCKTVLF